MITEIIATAQTNDLAMSDQKKAEHELYRLDGEYLDALDMYYFHHFSDPKYRKAYMDAKQALEDAEAKYNEMYEWGLR